MKRNRPVSLALVGLLLWVSGCTSWTPIGISEVADHGKVRVTTIDGEREMVNSPRMDTDSIKGQVNRGSCDPACVLNAAIPVNEVAEVEAAGVNTGATILTVLGCVAVIFLTVGFFTCGFQECG